jgi:hypothetical protein
MSLSKSTCAIVLGAGMLILAPAALAEGENAGNRDELPAICTDRPTKSNYACTVEPDHVQIETDLFNVTSDRDGASATDAWFVFNPTLKYGIASGIDIEANFAPLVIVRSESASGTSQIAGPSDLYVRLKYRFFESEGSRVQATLLPYFKAPIARPGIGNGAWEGGLLLPVNVRLTDTVTLTTVPELDILENRLNGGRHLSTAQLVNIGLALPANFTLYAELWGAWHFDPAGTVRQYSADAALAYAATPYLQIDAGLNIGLNAATPDIQGYIGIAQKF